MRTETILDVLTAGEKDVVKWLWQHGFSTTDGLAKGLNCAYGSARNRLHSLQSMGLVAAQKTRHLTYGNAAVLWFLTKQGTAVGNRLCASSPSQCKRPVDPSRLRNEYEHRLAVQEVRSALISIAPALYNGDGHKVGEWVCSTSGEWRANGITVRPDLLLTYGPGMFYPVAVELETGKTSPKFFAMKLYKYLKLAAMGITGGLLIIVALDQKALRQRQRAIRDLAPHYKSMCRTNASKFRVVVCPLATLKAVSIKRRPVAPPRWLPGYVADLTPSGYGFFHDRRDVWAPLIDGFLWSPEPQTAEEREERE